MKHRVLLGGYSSEVPPLPIPNREVKLTNADGTAYLGGRVGSRLFKPSWIIPTRLFLCIQARGCLVEWLVRVGVDMGRVGKSQLVA